MNTKKAPHKLTHLFVQSAMMHAKEFPDHGGLVICSPDEAFYISPDILSALQTHPALLDDFLLAGAMELGKAKTGALAFPHQKTKQGLPFSVIMLNTEKCEQSSSLIFAFDHETGHIFVPSGHYHPEGNVRESAANAYATLMHFQRLKFNNLLTFYPFASAEHVIYNSPIHYTPGVYFALEKIAQQVPLHALPLRAASNLSDKLAKLYSLPQATLDKIYKAYKKPRKKLNSIFNRASAPQRSLKEVANTMLQHTHDDDIYRAGRLFLATPGIEEKCRHDDPDFWNVAFAKMRAHEHATGFTLDMAKAIDAKRGHSPLEQLAKETMKDIALELSRKMRQPHT